MKTQNTYNGYKNYNTWNVALWIANDYRLYNAAVMFMMDYRGKAPYKEFIKYIELEDNKTLDEVPFIDKSLSYRELNEFMRGLI